MTYEEALARIASLAPRGWRQGLDRMQAFCAAAGLEDSLGGSGGPKFIHVAGTNGKGSTTAYLQSLLVTAGFNTGAFFSPYVVDPRERIQIGREMIRREELAELTDWLWPIAERFTETEYGGISEFEFKTALGFEYWKRKGCEWVALEVGLGGRLDATNVVSPKASIVVSIGHDHMNILGHSLTEIAFEKAGVVKPGVPVILGDLPRAAMQVIESIAAERGAPVWRFGQEVRWRDGTVVTPRAEYRNIETGLYGAMQGHNLSLAIAALQAAGLHLSETQVREGAALARIPGRFQVHSAYGRKYVLDGAHNPESAIVLRATLDQAFPGQELTLVTNMLQGHEPAGFYEVLRGKVVDVHVVPIDFHRARPVDESVADLKRYFSTVTGHASVREGLLAAATCGRTVLVTGSFYLVGDAIRLLEKE